MDTMDEITQEEQSAYTEEKPQEEQVESATQDEVVKFSDDEKIDLGDLSYWTRKIDFVDKELTVVPTDLELKGYKCVLYFTAEGENRKLEISKQDGKKVLDLLGGSKSEWTGKTLSIKGEPHTWNIKGKETEGTKLIFS